MVSGAFQAAWEDAGKRLRPRTMDANSRRLGRSPNVLARPPGEVRTQRSVLPCRVACSSKPSSVATMRAVRTAEGVTQCTRRLRLVAGRKGIEGRRKLELLKGQGGIRWLAGRPAAIHLPN